MRRLFNFRRKKDLDAGYGRSELAIDAFPTQSPEHDLYCYRRQHGVNLGSWFVLERWISEAPFRFAAEPGQSDLDVARGSRAKEVLMEHWDTWVTESDFKWLAEHGVNTVRIPIGYYHLCGADASVLQNTDFRGFARVFEGAWTRIVNAVEIAQRFQIGVLFDLHAAPGKQNRDAHSGTSASHPAFFNASNFQLMIRVLRILVTQLLSLRSSHSPPLNNVVGVELLNEPQPPAHDVLRVWYLNVIRELRSLDPGLPIYIADCWQTEEYTEFIHSFTPSPSLIALDHHLYRCFTASDISTPASLHASSLSDPNASVPRMFAQSAEKLESAGGALVIGEWSGALNPGSLHGALDERQERVRYVQAQLALYEQHCAGWFFWTYKKEQPGDQGWSFRDAVKWGVLPSHFGLKPVKDFRGDPGDQHERKASLKQDALGRHASHWAQYPGYYEHWRFEQGFNQGWDDAYLFLTSSLSTENSASELGFKGSWAKRKTQDHIRVTASNSNIWEFEHGFKQGVDAAKVDFQRIFC
ncbi:glycoside hydrolase family 5 protein [Leucogyrophana mollusca]|uniref:Glycoside hydrolase family 5 protein n=1 Tax=Leucogyrophana mollusca TaxID=85980 RepID=A0ACB8B6D4_9AGAM|nr:glycoside hydrolase family 5 protein [Leucogyrophana mollusca]